MSALAWLLIGVGAFMCVEAYKGIHAKSPATPVKAALKVAG